MTKKITRAERDPTNQAMNRARANRDNNARLNSAAREILTLWRDVKAKKTVRKRIINQSNLFQDFYLYESNTGFEQVMTTDRAIRTISGIIDDRLETAGVEPPPNWYFQRYLESATRSAVLQESAQLAALFDETVNTLTSDQIFVSETYRRTLRNSILNSYRLLDTLSTVTSSQVFEVIRLGVDGGLSKTAIRRQIVERFEVSKSRSKRIVDTEINRAYNDTRMNTIRANREAGANVAVMHISALLPTTRPHHADRHGKVYTVEQQERWWNISPNRINCFIPGTKVSGRFNAGLKSFYRGKVIEFVTRNGRNIAVTPNHNIMTDSGLIPAAKIRKGDNFIAYSIKNKCSIGVSSVDVDQANAVIEDVFASLSEIGNSSMIGVVGVDFNGYERFIMDKNINRVFSERELTFAPNAEALQFLDHLKLKHANSTPIRSRSFLKSFNRVFLTSSRFVSGLCNKLIIFFTSMFEPVELPLAAISSVKSSFTEQSINNSSRNPNIFRNCIDGFSSNVSLDEVVSINVSDFSGHVYDLEESSGLMIANEIIASNCHCSVRTVRVNKDGTVVDKKAQQKIIARGKEIFEPAPK